MRLFYPSDNNNSIIQIGTQQIPFPRESQCTFKWIWGFPYVKYGYGYYDPATEFRNPGLYGSDENIDETFISKHWLKLVLGAGAVSYFLSKKR